MDNRTKFLERRLFPRVSKTLSCKIFTEGFDIVSKTINLSANGVLCELDKHIEPFTKLQIIIFLPLKQNNGSFKTTKISCRGVVIRSVAIEDSGRYKVAVFFNQISKLAAGKISSYVKSNL